MDTNKTNVWYEFAKITGGEFIEGKSWHSDRTEIEYKEWKIVFDNYTLWSGKYHTQMTRVIVSFISNDDFKFEIYRAGFIRHIIEFFGARDIEIGRSEFDKAFNIKANNEFKVKKLLQNKKILNCLEDLKEVNIQICDQEGIWENKLPENELQLSYFADGKIDDFEILKLLLNLFKEFIDELSQMNSINPLRIL